MIDTAISLSTRGHFRILKSGHFNFLLTVDRGVDWRVNRKARRGKRLNCADRSFNRKSNRTRSRVEHAFGVVKHLWGYRKVRYRGLEKNGAQVFTLFALANFYLARRELAAT